MNRYYHMFIKETKTKLCITYYILDERHQAEEKDDTGEPTIIPSQRVHPQGREYYARIRRSFMITIRDSTHQQ